MLNRDPVPLVASLLERRFVFCGGKGGVGKTSIAAALGMVAARSGQEVRVISTDPAHSLGDVFERRLGHRPSRIEPGLEAVELDPDRCMDAYLDDVARRLRDYVKPALYAEIDRQMEQARHSPGAAEAALLEEIAGILADPDDACELTIFDTAPTGYTLRLVSLPETMVAWIEGLLGARRKTESVTRAFRGLVGRDRSDPDEARRARLAAALERRRRRFAGARDVLTDPARTAFLLVLIPERLPLEETARAIDALRHIGIEPAGLVVNQVLPDFEEGDFFGARRRVQQRWLARISRQFEGLARIELPLLADEVSRSGGLDALAALLAETFETRDP